MSQAGSFNTGGVFPPGSVVQTLTGNTGGAVGPDGANNINVVGDGTTITIAGNAGTNTLTASTTGTVATQYTTDAGVAIPAAGNLNVFGGTAGRDINTSGAGSTINVDLNNTISLGDLVDVTGTTSLDLVSGDATIQSGNLNLATTLSTGQVGIITVNAIDFIHSFGTGNTFVGENAGNLTLTPANATFNTAQGYHALMSLTDGPANTAVGAAALTACDTGSGNSAFGFQPLASLTSGSNNTAVGGVSMNSLLTGSNNVALGGALSALVTGNSNIAIGDTAGQAYNGAESENIVIGNQGVVGESNTIRIGTTGGGGANQTSCYISGIDGVNVGSTAKVVTMGTAGTADQLGTATITAGTNITITPGANTITISANADLEWTYTAVNTTPYVVLTTDQFLGVDCSGGTITIQLPNAPSVGRVFAIKDSTGNANTNNITVTTVGGVVNIDGATSYVMNTQYAAIEVIFNGTSYEIF